MKRPVLLLIALGLMAGKALAQEREWSLDASDEEAYLIFGVADTEDVGVSLWCPLKKGVVSLFVPQPTEDLQKLKRKTLPVTIKAGPETATFAGKVDINRDNAISSVEIQVPVSHPLLKAMQSSDRFDVKVDQADVVFPLYDADVAGLLDLCREK
ncbi:hypothetical protein [Aestuariivirga sp.]|uniref:hypothetical protein n=1 Tax=Aestuariivirga sp. TaxID=2650926 RepID=UPI003BA8ED66